MTGTIEARLTELGIELPAAPNPVANYVPYVISGNLLLISGQISKAAETKHDWNEDDELGDRRPKQSRQDPLTQGIHEYAEQNELDYACEDDHRDDLLLMLLIDIA